MTSFHYLPKLYRTALSMFLSNLSLCKMALETTLPLLVIMWVITSSFFPKQGKQCLSNAFLCWASCNCHLRAIMMVYQYKYTAYLIHICDILPVVLPSTCQLYICGYFKSYIYIKCILPLSDASAVRMWYILNF